jgi:hypothetical protein
LKDDVKAGVDLVEAAYDDYELTKAVLSAGLQAG